MFKIIPGIWTCDLCGASFEYWMTGASHMVHEHEANCYNEIYDTLIFRREDEI